MPEAFSLAHNGDDDATIDLVELPGVLERRPKEVSSTLKCYYCTQDRQKCEWIEGRSMCTRCEKLDYSCALDAPPNVDINRRTLSKVKCVSCRDAKQKCLPIDRVWPAKCERCVLKGLECSEPRTFSDIDTQKRARDDLVQDAKVSRTLPRRCPYCVEVFDNPSDYKKHILKHEKPFKCDVKGCPRESKGFTTLNDLTRHKKSVHRIGNLTRAYQCASTNCRNKDKIWPRLDNFKQHIWRMHTEEDAEDLIERSIYHGGSSTPTSHAPTIPSIDVTLAGTGVERNRLIQDLSDDDSDDSVQGQGDQQRNAIRNARTDLAMIGAQFEPHSPNVSPRPVFRAIQSSSQMSSPPKRTRFADVVQSVMSNTPEYRYQTLRHWNEIRLVVLMPAKSSDEEIKCSFKTCRLDEPLAYEAVSYPWDYNGPNQEVRIVSGAMLSCLSVLPTLHAALQFLRHPDRSRTFWIDALCLNYQDRPELARQMLLLPNIYKRATNVYAWLGTPTKDTESTFQFIRFLATCTALDYLTHSQYSKNWIHFLSLLTHPYFSRRWIIQEIAFSRKATIQSGHELLHWDDFADAVAVANRIESRAILRVLYGLNERAPQTNIPAPYQSISSHNEMLSLQTRSPYYSKQHGVAPYGNDVSITVDSKHSTPGSALSHSNQDMPTFPESVSRHLAAPPHIDIDPFLDIGSLGASRFVRVVSNLFRKSPDGEIVQRLMPLGDLLFDLAYCSVRDPRDAVYSLVRLSRDVSCPPVRPMKPYLRLASHGAWRLNPLDDSPRERLRTIVARAMRSRSSAQDRDELAHHPPAHILDIDYTRTTIEVFRKAVQYVILSSKSLDILCRPWAPSQVAPFPSWISTLKRAAFEPRHGGSSWVRINADPLVGLPGKEFYKASSDAKAIFRFDERGGESLFANGFVLDEIGETRTEAVEGNVPTKWMRLGNWTDTTQAPPDAFWRTLVADRGPNGENPPTFYRRACYTLFVQNGTSSAVNTDRIILNEPFSILTEFVRRLQAVVWNRQLIKTKSGILGLAPDSAEPGDPICILYGCSVPVVLRRTSPGTFTFLGESFVYGMMDGEAMIKQEQGPLAYPEVEFEIR